MGLKETMEARAAEKQSIVPIAPHILQPLSMAPLSFNTDVLHVPQAHQAPPMSINIPAMPLMPSMPTLPITITPIHVLAPSTIFDPLAVEVRINSDVDDWPKEFTIDGVDDNIKTQITQMIQAVAKAINTDDVSNAMSRVMIFIQEHPGTEDLLVPESLGILYQALKSSANIMLKAKSKNSSARSDKKDRQTQLSNELAGLGF